MCIGLFLVYISLWGRAPSFAQAHPISPANPTIGQTLSLKQPAFDRLELLALVVGTFWSPYVAHEIENRGLSFVPDAVFLTAVQELQRGPEIVEAIKRAKPDLSHIISPQRHAAYHVLLRAIEDMHKRLYASAEQEYQHALKLVPDSATLHLAYAADLILFPQYAQAEEECQRSLQLWPEDAEAHTLLATSLVGQNRDEEAIPEARTALRIFPAHKAALVALAMSLTRSRQYKEAIPVLREAIVRTPEMPLLRKHLGVSLFHSGDIDGAIDELTLFLKTNPNDAEGHYELGAALRAKGQQADAQAQFREAARIEPSNPVYATVAESDAAQEPPHTSTGQRPDDGSISGAVYTNKFFGFSFEFPKGWTVMSPREARSLVKFGGDLLSNGDPLLQDMTQAGIRNSYPLLFVAEGMTKSHTFSTRSIQIHALDKSVAPDLNSGEDFLKSAARLYKEMGMPIEIAGTPEKLAVGGREFWKANLDMRMNNGVQHGSQLVTLDKGYLLLFIFVSPDAASLDEIENTIQSLRFIREDASVSLPSASTGSVEQQSVRPTYTSSMVEILTPTDGIDFTEYLTRMVATVKENWLALIPQSARLGEKGRVVIQFHVLPDGGIPNADPIVVSSSAKDELDRSAVAAIRASAPFSPLPAAFKRPFMEIRVIFLYNLPMKN